MLQSMGSQGVGHNLVTEQQKLSSVQSYLLVVTMLVLVTVSPCMQLHTQDTDPIHHLQEFTQFLSSDPGKPPIDFLSQHIDLHLLVALCMLSRV